MVVRFVQFVSCLAVASLLAAASFADEQPADDKPTDAQPAIIGPPRTSDDYSPPALTDLGKKFKIKTVYLVPSDREPAKEYQAKTEVLLAFVRDVYVRDMLAKGYETDGPDFEFEDGRLKIHLLKTDKPASHYNFEPNYSNQPKVFDRIMPEVQAAHGPMQDNFYFVLAETYAFGPYPYEWPGNFALGGYASAKGGAGTFSSWIFQDELCATTIAEQMKLLADATPIKGRTAHGHGRPNSPRFEFIEDGFGAVVHELAHAFGLPHDVRQGQSDIMGHGFRRFRVNYLGEFHEQAPMCFSVDNGRFLAQSRYLCNDVDATDDKPPTASTSAPIKVNKDAKTIPIKVKATDDKSLAAIIFYTSQGDTVRGGRALEGQEQEFEYEVQVSDLQPGELRLQTHLIDRGGNAVVGVNVVTVE
jgi:hypothetical protein